MSAGPRDPARDDTRHGRGSVMNAGSPRPQLQSGSRRCRAASAAGHARPRLDPSALRSPARPHGTVRSGLRMTPFWSDVFQQAFSTQHSALSTMAMSDMEHDSRSGTEVAVIGMAGRFPGADTLDELWEMIAAGHEGITTFGDDELRAAGTPEALLRDPSFVRRLGVLRDVEGFDAAFFGY